MIKKINIELSVLIIGRVLQVFIALISIRLATKFLNASEMGNLYLILSIAGFFGLFLVGPVGQYINRKTHEWYDKKIIINVFYLYNYYIIFLLFFSVGILLVLKFLGIGSNIDFFYLMVFMLIYIFSHTWNQTIIPMMNMLEKRVVFIVFTLLSQLLYLVLAIVFISIFEKRGVFWFLGQGVSFGIVALIAFFYFFVKIQNQFDFKKANQMISILNLKNILKFSVPLSVSILFFWLQTQSYSIIIEKNIGAEFLGHFGVGMAVALAISSAFETIVMQYLYPQMYKSMSDDNKFSLVMSDIINLIIPLYLFLSIFVSFLAIFITSILVDIKFHSSYIFVIFGVWVSFFRMSSNIISNIAHSKMKTKQLIMPNFIGALIAVLGVFLATKFKNYELFIPLALLISGLISFIFLFIKMNKIVNINLRIKNLFLIFLYSLPFLISLILYQYSNDIFYSISIVSSFGLYFLYILSQKIIRKVEIIA